MVRAVDNMSMVSFIYDSKYKKSSFNETKKKIEASFSQYIEKTFGAYAEIGIQIIFLPTILLKNSIAITTPSERSIKFDFDRVYDYETELKQLGGKLDMPSILNKHNCLFNALHHEMQHFANSKDYKKVFDYIDSSCGYGYIKLVIHNLLDEYIASYSAQKQFFYSYGAVKGLKSLCKQKDMIVTEMSERVHLYKKIVDCLAYCIAENNVLCETKGECDVFDNILSKESVSVFKEIFVNIKGLLEDYNSDKYKEYVKGCQLELMKLAVVLHIDLVYFKRYDEMLAKNLQPV